ncbi:MAG: TatD family hydrolase [Clostridiaceae bacterium]|nr:TatD family hydrolase [Clostridiaceae bacterium]
MLIDSHAHYDDKQFDIDRDMVMKKIESQGVAAVVNPSENLASMRKVLEMSEAYGFLYAALGFHPHNAAEFSIEFLDTIREMSKSGKVVAIGEVGLDYYYDFSPREAQKKCFAAHISVAKELKLPLIIHDRDAHKDVIDIIKAENAGSAGGVFHCFPGSVEMAREVLDAGFYIALGGAVTFKNAKRPVEVAKYVPIDRLLVETDSPYMAPVPYRGKRNDSGYLPVIIEKIAEIRDMEYEQVARATAENACRLFNLRLSCQEG